MTRDERPWFYVQETPVDPWHVESRDNCEVMLCGKFISVDSGARPQTRWGQRRCPNCWFIWKPLQK